MTNQPAWNGIAGIVLDAVGTLITPDPPVAAVYADAARRQGVALDADQLKLRFRQSFQSQDVEEVETALATDEAAERRRWRRIVAEVLPGLPEPDRAFEELWNHFGQPAAWRCFSDVEPAMRRLRDSGLRLCIGSNFDGRLRKVVGGLPALAQLENALVISSEVGFRKPHASFYAAVCEELQLPPREVLSVGDELTNDVVGATRAGLRAVWIDRTGKGVQSGWPTVTTLTALAKPGPM